VCAHRVGVLNGLPEVSFLSIWLIPEFDSPFLQLVHEMHETNRAGTSNAKQVKQNRF
jgi:hypothetical protein